MATLILRCLQKKEEALDTRTDSLFTVHHLLEEKKNTLFSPPTVQGPGPGPHMRPGAYWRWADMGPGPYGQMPFVLAREVI